MRIQHGKLLIPLILLVAATCCAWTTAHARLPGSSGSVLTASVGASKPGAQPCSGEPDVGQTKLPTHGSLLPMATDASAGSGARIRSFGDWLRWIGRVWMARYLGAR
jgi:hypothetical protein